MYLFYPWDYDKPSVFVGRHSYDAEGVLSKEEREGFLALCSMLRHDREHISLRFTSTSLNSELQFAQAAVLLGLCVGHSWTRS